ncbi:MAG: methyltransferase domain-containing protein [Alphaproteobacteria bacterium]
MSFSGEWLALREPADHAARNADVLAAVAAHFAGRGDLAVTDLASGQGSTLRAVAKHLPPGQSWTLVDYDEALLDAAKALAADGEAEVATQRADLNDDLEGVLALPADLLTTSAFFDLVSKPWLTHFVKEAAKRRLPVYAALTYDGRMSCAPPDEHDAAAVAAFNRHQRHDKGFGPALGPTAAETAQRLFEAAGYKVTAGPSDWRLGAAEAELQRQLIEGWHGAVAELKELPPAALAAWRAARLAAIDAGTAELLVGHVDLFAVPR